jgi:hypothetical protein
VARGRGTAGAPQTTSNAPAGTEGVAANANSSAVSNPAATAAVSGGPNAGGQGGRGRNPNIIRDQASIDAATVPGKPVK